MTNIHPMTEEDSYEKRQALAEKHSEEMLKYGNEVTVFFTRGVTSPFATHIHVETSRGNNGSTVRLLDAMFEAMDSKAGEAAFTKLLTGANGYAVENFRKDLAESWIAMHADEVAQNRIGEWL